MTLRADSSFLVVSDLHLTSGVDPVSGAVGLTEDFLWDREFAAFLLHYALRPSCTLILNGDVFDFGQVLDEPSRDDRVRYGIRPQDMSARHGLRCTEAATLFRLDRIARGHPVFFDGLAAFLASGHTICLVKGNHDVALAWPAVQERVRAIVAERLPAGERASAATRFLVVPWNVYVPGLLYVEHGNQYEETCSFQTFLSPEHIPRDRADRAEMELDLAGFLLRYVVNRMEEENPLADNVRPLTRFYAVMVRERPLLLLSTLGSALIFALKAFRAAATASRSHGGAFAERRRRNDARVCGEADRWSGAEDRGDERVRRAFREISSSAAIPTLGRGALRFLWCLVRPGDSPLTREVVPVLRMRAASIARLLGVRVVSFGHSHVAESHPLHGGGRYVNTGTWMEVYEDRGRVFLAPRFVHLLVEEGEARLLRWDNDQSSAIPLSGRIARVARTRLRDSLAQLIRAARRTMSAKG